MPVPSLSGQRIVVLGGSSGMGFAVAEGALAEGAEVVVGSSSQEKVDAAVAQLGAGASGKTVDAGSEASIAAFFDGLGSIDHLVFTAGDTRNFAAAGSIAELNIAAASELPKIRFWGGLLAIKHALPKLADNASITLTGGVLAHRPVKGIPLVTAFAGATEHLVCGLAMDLAPRRVNAVCPGLIRTPLIAGWTDEIIQQWVGRQPLARAGLPEEAAQAYLYLMRAGFTTGQIIVVDGGAMLV
jgi:NAD(P)-dependent dehydrogenase (short-subunit alcohol dehydrogenase family)